MSASRDFGGESAAASSRVRACEAKLPRILLDVGFELDRTAILDTVPNRGLTSLSADSSEISPELKSLRVARRFAEMTQAQGGRADYGGENAA